MKKETIKFIFNAKSEPDMAIAYSVNTNQKKEIPKELIVKKLNELKNQHFNVSCKMKNRDLSSTFLFKIKNDNEEFLARIIINNDDPFYDQIDNLCNLYTLKKKYKILKIIALTTGFILVATNPTVQKHASNFVKNVIEKDDEKFIKEADLNKLNSLISRLQINGLSREEYYELRNLISKYQSEIEEPEKYEQIINENQEKIR